VKVRPFFIEYAQSPELIQPGKGSLHHPSPSAQSNAVFGVALGEPRHDVMVAQTLPDCICVHNHGRTIRSPDDGVDVPALPARFRFSSPYRYGSVTTRQIVRLIVRSHSLRKTCNATTCLRHFTGEVSP
jgi:hypothetical protein